MSNVASWEQCVLFFPCFVSIIKEMDKNDKTNKNITFMLFYCSQLVLTLGQEKKLLKRELQRLNSEFFFS